jgi:hypothetical protein
MPGALYIRLLFRYIVFAGRQILAGGSGVGEQPYAERSLPGVLGPGSKHEVKSHLVVEAKQCSVPSVNPHVTTVGVDTEHPFGVGATEVEGVVVLKGLG